VKRTENNIKLLTGNERLNAFVRVMKPLLFGVRIAVFFPKKYINKEKELEIIYANIRV